MALAIIGITAATLGAMSLADSDASRAHSDFAVASDQVAADLSLAIEREDDLLVSGATFVLENPHVSEAGFRAWATLDRTLPRYPELIGIGKLVIVGAAHLAAFRAEVADSLGLHGAQRQFPILPLGQRAYYCLNDVGIARTAGVKPPPGIDFCAANSGLMAQRDSGREMAIPVAASEGAPGELIIDLPVYRGGVTPATVAARRSAFVGWIGLGVNATVLLRQALRRQPGIVAVLRRAGTGGPAAHAGPPASPTVASGKLPRGATRVMTDLLDGSTVETFKRLGGAGVASEENSLLVLIGGIVMSLLLALLVLVLGTGRTRALRLVREKTGELRFQAMHDDLTGLPNRALVIDRAEQLLARARRRPSPLAALFIDVDGFKHVNDTFGHAAGDELLQVVAGRLSGVIRNSDTVGRMGGDEFVALLEGASLAAGPELVAGRLLEELRQPIELAAANGREVTISASIGIAAGERANAEELLRDADLALYRAKQAGKDRFVLFQQSMQVEANDRRTLEADLSHALERDQLFLLYQPTFDLPTRLVIGVEALIRWRHPTRGVVKPAVFIPLAEQTAMIVPIGRWVLRTACRQAATWRANGHQIGISVNVTARQLQRDEFVDEVREALAHSGLAPGDLTLEITETVLMRHADAAAARLRAIKTLGVRIAIDDFGTGYSSLAYLRTSPVDAIKIGRSFIAAIGSVDESGALIHTLVALGKTLGLETLGEGIEEPDQLAELLRQQCDSGQGFLLARPLEADLVEEFLACEQPVSTTPPS